MKKKKKEQKKVVKSTKKAGRKLSLALDGHFFLEALWIESSMIEKKLKKVLLKSEYIEYGSGFTLEQVIKRVKYLHQSGKHPFFSEAFEIGLIDELRHWKNQRNAVLKDMLDVHVSPARMERLALEGQRLLKSLAEAGKKFDPDGETSPGH